MSNVNVGHGLLVEEEVAEGLVGFGQLLDEFGTLLLDQLLDLCGDVVRLGDLNSSQSLDGAARNGSRHLPLDTLIVDRLHPHDVYNTAEVVFRSDWDLHGRGVQTQLRPQL